jgi:hypothetical protein
MGRELPDRIYITAQVDVAIEALQEPERLPRAHELSKERSGGE